MRSLLAGQNVGMINEIKSVEEVISGLVEGIRVIFERNAAG